MQKLSPHIIKHSDFYLGRNQKALYTFQHPNSKLATGLKIRFLPKASIIFNIFNSDYLLLPKVGL